MAKRSIEETFEAIKPKGRKGIPNAPTIAVGVSSNNGDLSTSLSQAGQQIAQLQSAYQQQASLISANTQAVQGNTSAQGKGSIASTAMGAASSLFGGLGLLSPIISGIASLFGGGSKPTPLPTYTPPSPIAINASLSSATPNAPAQNAGGTGTAAAAIPVTSSTSSPAATPITSSTSSQGAAAPQITVNVNAMDSKSFMDHSTDIANAVREAMLNMHPINGVVTSL